MGKYIVLALLSFIIFLIAVIYITFPLIFHLKDFVNGEYVIAWILNWNIHNVLTGNILHIFQANIYYPYINSLAYSDFLFSSSLFALIPYLLLREPMVPSNITFFSSLILLGFFTYLLAFYLTRNFLASLLSGLLIIFSPVVLDKRIHLQILSIEWIPISVLFFLHYCKTGKFKYLLLTLLFFVVQTYNSFMAGYFLVFSLITLTGVLSYTDKMIRLRMLVWKNGIALVCTLVVIIPICIPYYQVSAKYHYVRDIRDSIHFAIQPEDLFVAADYSRLNPLLTMVSKSQRYPANAEIKPGFLGLIFLILSICTVVYIFWRKKKNIYLLAFLSVAFIGLILSFGPALHLGRKTIHQPFLIPLPYLIFYYIAPGFEGFRNSARFEMLFILALPIGIAIMLNEFLGNKKKFIVYGIYVILLIGTILEYNFPMHFEHALTFEKFPPVYTWISKNTQVRAVIIEVPMYNWDNNPFGDNQEVRREYYSTIHFRNLVGGGSGFSPPPWQDMAKFMYANFPSQEAILNLKMLNVNYIIVHTDEYSILHKEKWVNNGSGVPDGTYIIRQLQNNPNLVLVKQLKEDFVYKIISTKD